MKNKKSEKELIRLLSVEGQPTKRVLARVFELFLCLITFLQLFYF
jgi:hypothetical protein